MLVIFSVQKPSIYIGMFICNHLPRHMPREV